ncbi:GspH/FimT family pseudopilin [Microbulbifer halophilus]|uniref:Type II secretion system protein H n=1 Tax=Microbulbifer halophilus TaxID=453963 RepID=A0ABW5E5B4_9GAMM|nr:GspH/FimT family pseudopilin [Microbulbifer halophilus]MCW8127499.1 GspH/FimT family pseudopilin [Microbulbifer halophilus]
MKKASGFTLVELMLTLTILAVVMAVAIPPMADFLNRHRNETQRQRLFDLVALARSKAYSEGKIYTLCGSTDGEECSGDWSAYILLFVDSNGNHERESDETIERKISDLPADASLEWNSLQDYLQYRPDGHTQRQTGNFKYCPPDGAPDYGWIIVLNATGRPYFGRDGDGDGIVEDGSGNKLNCAAG